MDVRCEKCQTEYELDEARLKPGGVTVKCTNCGHMFKVRRRAPTNMGAAPPPGEPRARPSASRSPPSSGPAHRDSMLHEPDHDSETVHANYEGPTTVERQWVIRLQNGEQKSCRELATLQQWIIAGVVTREAMISRTGKTWKRLGDIAELAQYFDIADEARTVRDSRPAARPTPSAPGAPGAPGAASRATPSPAAPRAQAASAAPQLAGRGTMLGVSGGPAAQAAGGTILPDDDDDNRRTGRAPLPPRLPAGAKTPPMGAVAAPAPPRPAPPSAAPPPAARRPITEPPPPPVPPAARRPATEQPPPPAAKRTPPSAAHAPTPAPPMKLPIEGRSTAAWASEPVRPPDPASRSGPFVGKLSAIPDEPAFAGRFRTTDPEVGQETGQVSLSQDDDDLMPGRRGTRAGLWIVLALLAFGGAAAAGVYLFVIKDPDRQVATQTPPPDQGSAQAADAAIAATEPDAAESPATSPAEAARGELYADHEARMRAAFESLSGKDEPAAQAMRALLATGLAQALTDRASLGADRSEADKLRREVEKLVMEAASSAQRALKAVPDDAAANLAMAAVLRLQRKQAATFKRYSDAAKQKGDPAWARDIALADALVLARDGKLDEARAAFAAIDQGEGRLEASNDVRARFQLAKLALAQGKAAEAKPLVEQVLAAQPEHAGARALAAKIETAVAKSDPLPPEEDPKDPKEPKDPKDPKDPKEPRDSGTGAGSAPRPPDDTGTGPGPVAGGSYEALLKRADTAAENNCVTAIPIYQKALEQKSNGVEALTGLGYCYVDQKQFASAFGKFRSALAISSRYEPALWGIGEAYLQQGRKEQAIEAFQRYLEVYPGSVKAQKQLERLGGAAGGGGTPPGGGGGGGGGGDSPTPAPAPAPAPPPAGDGSGSG